MPFNGSGVFERLYNWEADAAAGIPISSDRFDADGNDVAQALSMCLTRDGQSSMGAVLNMSGYIINNLGLATADAHALSRAAGDARYVKFNSDGTISGTITIANASPSLILNDTDTAGAANGSVIFRFNNVTKGQIGPMGTVLDEISLRAQSGDLIFQADYTNARAGSLFHFQLDGTTDAAVIDVAGTTLASDVTVVTRQKADFRYLQKTGGALTGLLTTIAQIQGITPIGAADLTRKDYVDGLIAGRLTQTQGDARYAQLAALNTFVAKQTFSAGATVDVIIDGTAVTQSQTDQTAGRLMKVGDWGLGVNQGPTITDFTLALANGFHRFLGSQAAGGPDSAAWQYSAFVNNNSTGSLVLALRASGANTLNGRMFIGNRNGTTGAMTWSQVALADIANTFSAAQTFSAGVTMNGTGPNLMINDTDATVGGASVANVQFNASGVLNGWIGFNSANMRINSMQRNLELVVDQNNASASSKLDVLIDGAAAGNIAATIQPRGPTTLTDQDVITREKGDALYLKSAATQTIQTPKLLNPFIVDVTDQTKSIHLLADNLPTGVNYNIRVPAASGTLALIEDISPIVDAAVNGLNADNPVYAAWTPDVTFAVPGDFAPVYGSTRAGQSISRQYEVDIAASIDGFTANAYTTASGDLRISGFPINASAAAFPVSIIATCKGLVNIPWWAQQFKFRPVPGQPYGNIVYSNDETIWSIPFSCVAGQRLFPGDYVATNSARHAMVRHVEHSSATGGTIYLANILNDSNGQVGSIPSGNTLTGPTGQVYTTTAAQTLVNTTRVPVTAANIPPNRAVSIWFGGWYIK